MHKSRLAGFIIDCLVKDKDNDNDNDPADPATSLDAAARFWSRALGLQRSGPDGDGYERLDATARDLHLEVQSVQHESRVHLDIETDDLDAEVRRLESLGARRLKFAKRWWVMEAPTGHRFCVVKAPHALSEQNGATKWETP